ncbi:MAG: hypothetical protein JSW72_01365, partial [Candidatus Bathyarchaeota archaeon]
MKFRFSLILVFIFSLVLILGLCIPMVVGEEWIPCVPYPEFTDLEFWMENETAFVTVTVIFNSGGFNTSDWGTVETSGNVFSANSKFWVWTGKHQAVILIVSHNYSLGQLEEGVYVFEFWGWAEPVESIVFEVGYPADINDDGKVDIMDIAIVALAYGAHAPDPNYNPD